MWPIKLAWNDFLVAMFTCLRIASPRLDWSSNPCSSKLRQSLKIPSIPGSWNRLRYGQFIPQRTVGLGRGAVVSPNEALQPLHDCIPHRSPLLAIFILQSFLIYTRRSCITEAPQCLPGFLLPPFRHLICHDVII